MELSSSKLSLVGNQANITTTEPSQNSHRTEDILARLPSVLQTSLDLDIIISLFEKEITEILDYDSLHYQHQGVQSDIMIGSKSHHSCNYRLEMNGVWLGEITLTRRTKFSDSDTLIFEDLLCKLIYPIRNCLLLSQAQAAALQDSLTGLNNRGAFDLGLKREIDLAHRQHLPLSLIILDIDHFKAVNDKYGHSSGDLALQQLAQSITETMRLSDISFRYGGEEFTLILSNTSGKSAQIVAERLRKAVANLHCSDGSRTFGLTISLGIAQLALGESDTSLFDRADQALYQAKKSGRNKFITA